MVCCSWDLVAGRFFSKDLYYLGPLPRSCGHAHRALIGANDTGGFKTAPAAAYPPQMNEMIATLLFQHWHKHLPRTPDGRGVEKDAVAGVENRQDGDLGKEVEAEKARAREGPPEDPAQELAGRGGSYPMRGPGQRLFHDGASVLTR